MEKIALAELKSQGYPEGLKSGQGLPSNSWGNEDTSLLLAILLTGEGGERKRESEWAREKCIAFLTILQAFGRASHWLTLTRSPGKCDLHGSNHHDTEHSKGKVGSALKKKIHSNGNDFAEATWASPVAKTVKNLLAMQETWI